ncbi:NfeD family protein [Arsenicicoccus sp. oral taxon 190]|uniref:NfeD family protein n=1 Tax=Arsenicicoccus sp. oral taxon 190 TaxID=1658671 RepID=UPI000679F5A3|nr:NfeD family protein [Arsenicicoccus sp. oral taxon 190]AKT51954.1 membrane protein [Arsenicicoccus sp. oral taxon 190]
MEWFADNGWLAWVGLALILGAIEAASVDFFFLMLAGGSLAGAVAAALGAGLAAQVVVAVAVALVLVLAVRPLVKRRFTIAPDTTIGAGAYIGRAALVTETVTTTSGLVKLAGETWTARTGAGQPAIPAGQEVRVVSIEGATAVVADAAERREGF